MVPPRCLTYRFEINSLSDAMEGVFVRAVSSDAILRPFEV